MKKYLFFILFSLMLISRQSSALPFLQSEYQQEKEIEYVDSLNMKLMGIWNYGYFSRSAYMNEDHLYLASGGGVVIFDISDTTNPEKASDIQFPGQSVRDIFVQDTILIIANWEKGIRIANVADPHNPIEISSYDCEFVYAVSAKRNLIFTTECRTINGKDIAVLAIYDIGDPLAPYKLAEHTLASSFVSELFIDSCYAYVANRPGGLRVIDISDSTNPFEIAHCPIPGLALHPHMYCDSLLLLGTGPNSYYSGGLWVIEVSDPYNPTPIGCDTSFWLGWDVTSFFPYAYVSTYESVVIIDLSDPANPFTVGQYFPPYLTVQINAHANADDHIYAAESHRNGLRTIDASNPANPVAVDYDLLPNQSYDVAIQGDYAYVANRYSGMYILDISDPWNPFEISNFDTDGQSNAIVARDSIAFVADSGSILGFNVTNPYSPEKISELALACDGYGLLMNYPYLYVTSDQGHHFAIVNVSDPYSPYVTGMCYLDNNCPSYMCYKDSLVFVSAPPQGIAVVNVADVSNPFLVTYAPLPGYILGIDLSGNYLYASSVISSFIYIVDISDPFTPMLVDSFPTIDFDPVDLTIIDTLLYVAAQIVGIEVFNISSPLDPQLVGYYRQDPLVVPQGITATSEFVYLCCDNGIFILKYTGSAGIEEEHRETIAVKTSLKLLQNPVRKSSIQLILTTNSSVNYDIGLFNVLGQQVKSFNLKNLSVGKNHIDLSIDKIPNGIYFLRLKDDCNIQSEKVVILK